MKKLEYPNKVKQLKADYVVDQLGLWDNIIPDLFGTQEWFPEWVLRIFSEDADKQIQDFEDLLEDEQTALEGQAELGADLLSGDDGSVDSQYKKDYEAAWGQDDDLDRLWYPQPNYGQPPSAPAGVDSSLGTGNTRSSAIKNLMDKFLGQQG